jgi:hypothetical protein
LLSFFAGAAGFDAAGAAPGLAAGVAAPGGAFADDCTATCAAFLSAEVWVTNFLVGENSPNLCPTISSEIVIGMNVFPL